MVGLSLFLRPDRSEHILLRRIDVLENVEDGVGLSQEIEDPHLLDGLLGHLAERIHCLESRRLPPAVFLVHPSQHVRLSLLSPGVGHHLIEQPAAIFPLELGGPVGEGLIGITVRLGKHSEHSVVAGTHVSEITEGGERLGGLSGKRPPERWTTLGDHGGCHQLIGLATLLASSSHTPETAARTAASLTVRLAPPASMLSVVVFLARR